jgi:hypothetical protein
MSTLLSSLHIKLSSLPIHTGVLDSDLLCDSPSRSPPFSPLDNNLLRLLLSIGSAILAPDPPDLLTLDLLCSPSSL